MVVAGAGDVGNDISSIFDSINCIVVILFASYLASAVHSAAPFPKSPETGD